CARVTPYNGFWKDSLIFHFW
nr:immunoglobulin heavy chain junction region [Macaca mulatta]MOV36610.1 immunoglobulin heavy chain junction region [Macaca mulatta]